MVKKLPFVDFEISSSPLSKSIKTHSADWTGICKLLDHRWSIDLDMKWHW